MAKEISSTQENLPIAASLEGVVVLKNGQFIQIIIVSSLNFALKAEKEQEAIIFQYQNFLNSLAFPIQILVQSRKLDLKPYLDELKEREKNETNQLLGAQISSYLEFVDKLINLGNIMSKRFFVVVPYRPIGLKQENIFAQTIHPAVAPMLKISKDKFDSIHQELRERVNVIVSGLSSVGLKAVPLSTQQTIELLYSIYNPEESAQEKLVDEQSLQAKIVHTSEEPLAQRASSPEGKV